MLQFCRLFFSATGSRLLIYFFCIFDSPLLSLYEPFSLTRLAFSSLHKRDHSNLYSWQQCSHCSQITLQFGDSALSLSPSFPLCRCLSYALMGALLLDFLPRNEKSLLWTTTTIIKKKKRRKVFHFCTHKPLWLFGKKGFVGFEWYLCARFFTRSFGTCSTHKTDYSHGSISLFLRLVLWFPTPPPPTTSKPLPWWWWWWHCVHRSALNSL